MTFFKLCDGGCGRLIDPLNENVEPDPGPYEGPPVFPTLVTSSIEDPFSGEFWQADFCGHCSRRLFANDRRFTDEG